MTCLDRRPGEDTHSHVHRLVCFEPLAESSTDSEIAGIARTSAAFVRSVRREANFAMGLLLDVSRDIAWDGPPGDLVRAAVVDFALGYCSRGECTHPICRSSASGNHAHGGNPRWEVER